MLYSLIYALKLSYEYIFIDYICRCITEFSSSLSAMCLCEAEAVPRQALETSPIVNTLRGGESSFFC